MSRPMSLTALTALAVSLAALGAGLAAADPKPACAPTGDPMFEVEDTVRQGTGTDVDHRLYANGAWAIVTKDPTAPTASLTGCATPAQLADAKAALAAAKWQVTSAKVRCMARTNNLTIYSAAGKEVFRKSVCSGQSLDADSAAAVDKLTALFELLRAHAT